MSICHLDEAATTAALDASEVTDVLERVLGEWGRGEAESTVRVRAAAGEAMASAMAAVIPSLGVSGGKLYATAAGRFTFHVVLFDLDGRLLCTLDGEALTAVRTAALSAVAIRRLGPPAPTRGAVLGTGLESLPHVEMLARELALDEVRIWGRTAERAEAVVAAARRREIPAVRAPTSEEAVDGADVVVTVTSADEPVVSEHAVADHALVCAVGATKPRRCELPPALFARAGAVVTDSLAGARVECGDLVTAVARGALAWSDVAELHHVVAERRSVPRAGTAPGPIIMETQGVALQDVLAAALAWRRHTERRSTTKGTPTP